MSRLERATYVLVALAVLCLGVAIARGALLLAVANVVTIASLVLTAYVEHERCRLQRVARLAHLDWYRASPGGVTELRRRVNTAGVGRIIALPPRQVPTTPLSDRRPR